MLEVQKQMHCDRMVQGDVEGITNPSVSSDLVERDVAAFDLENYRCNGNYGANGPWLATNLAMVRRKSSSSNEL